MRARLLLALVAVLPAAAAPAAAAPPPAVPLYRTFGRWIVACDNTRSCEARGFDEVTRADLRLLRDAGAAPARLVLSAGDPFDVTALRLDGAALPLHAPAWTTDTSDGGTALATDDPRAVAAFIGAARNAHALTLDAAPASGDDPPRLVPLDGFTAALLLVDAVQGRPGTSGALVAPAGANQPPAAPPVPPAPVWVRPRPLSAAEARAIAARLRTLRSPSFDVCDVTDPPTVDALDAGHAIAIRPCYRAAYQTSYLVEMFPRGGGPPVPLRLTLPGVPGDEPQGPDMVEADFDPASGRLTTAAKGRGLADCGLSAAWTWSRGAFRLTSLAYQEPCGGALPGDWPTLFRTRERG
ncbi:MAG: DUF1176 domain-containing protein [Acidisphaera sp.]|nr:DUF1176 domain-containing protein [Acidisphaera sp.]